MKKLVWLLLLACCAAQTPVSNITPPRFQSLLNNGVVNAFGCVWTYANNTTTPIASYTDYTGSIANPNPVPLDSAGSANIWLSTGTLYTIVIKTTGGTNCSLGTTLSTTNGVNQSLLNTANTWVSSQTFSSPIFLSPADLQIVFGNPVGTQTTLDIPPTASNLVLHGPTITANDTLLSQNATQTVTNKNLTTGTQVNGCGMTNGPGTYVCIANNGSTATVLNELTVLTGAPSTATVAPAGTASPVIGVTVANAGITGTAVIQASGIVSCVFDGSTTAGDGVIPSASVNGNCHDSGSVYAPGGNNIGRVLATNGGGAGTYSMLLSLQNSAPGTICAAQPISSNLNTGTVQILQTCGFAAGALNQAGKSFRVTSGIEVIPAASGSSQSNLYWGFGTTSALGTYFTDMFQSSSAVTFFRGATMTCTVNTTGASGALSCVIQGELTGGASDTLGTAVISVTPLNLTGSVFVGTACGFNTASTTNVCDANVFTVEQLN